MRSLAALLTVSMIVGCSTDSTPTAESEDVIEDSVEPDVEPDVEPQEVTEEDASEPDPLPRGEKDPPEVPDNGWAKAVVDADILDQFEDESGAIHVNVATDPEQALGPPEGDLSGLVALGLEGNYIIVDLGADTQALDVEGADVVVMELGIENGGFPEPYTVSVASEEDGPYTPLGTGAGPRGFDLSLVELTSARYVRVESTATVELVTSGLGSPLWPGGEIDAIGAVSPGTP